jgi:hypothetical protein
MVKFGHADATSELVVLIAVLCPHGTFYRFPGALRKTVHLLGSGLIKLVRSHKLNAHLLHVISWGTRCGGKPP